MENKTGLNRQSNSLWRSFKNGDFEEQDVWDVLKEKTIISMASDNFKVNDNSLYESPSSVSAAARTIPRPSHGGVAGGNNSKSTTYETHIAQQSAPLPIPQWFINKGGNPRKGSNNDVDDDDEDDDDDDDDDNEYGSKVPPHEMIAKRLAKTQISSFSVFEGAGRTLKGRDLSKVRNAVLIKTGFLESL